MHEQKERIKVVKVDRVACKWTAHWALISVSLFSLRHPS